MAMTRRRLGVAGPVVSAVSLGSWRTFERMERADAVAVMVAAREAGITFLDDARYDDESGTAPLPTGWSEVVFGEVFRAAGWDRDAVVVANKLWWEFWPRQDAAAELAASLRRLGLDRVDLIYAERRPAGMTVADVVREVSGLLQRGSSVHWGLLNWSAADTAEAVATAGRLGVAAPVATQLPYSAALRSVVEDREMTGVLSDTGVSVVASATLAGGLLTGKYADPAAAGRMAGKLEDPRARAVLAGVPAFLALAADLGVAPAALAVGYALADPRTGSVLLGATAPAQIEQNVAAVPLDDATRDRVRACFPERPGR
ncbi:MAG TPA: aldo/keto reductase [Mycobacteriales bacterium]|nr:aldo/keto reductase [Mycobacteriales bacterium]